MDSMFKHGANAGGRHLIYPSPVLLKKGPIRSAGAAGLHLTLIQESLWPVWQCFPLRLIMSDGLLYTDYCN